MDDNKELEKLQERLEAKIQEANNAYIEADKEGRKDLSDKQTELKGEIAEIQSSLDKLATSFEKMKTLSDTPKDHIRKAFEEKAEALKGLATGGRNKSEQVHIKHDDLFTKAITAGNALGDRRVIPFDRVIDTPVFDPEERPLRDFFRTGSTTSDTVDWPVEKIPDGALYNFDNEAGAVDSDAAAAKPVSDFEWDLVERRVRDIAHVVTLHKNLMADLAVLQTYLPGRMRDGILREESRQILVGQNGQNEMVGLNQTGSHADFDISGFQAAVIGNNKAVANANFIDILGYAMTQVRLNRYSPSLILLNPSDMYSLMFAVDEDGRYLMNTPNYAYVAAIAEQNTYVPQGEFWTIDANRSNLLLFRDNVTIDFSYENKDNFEKNLVTIRGEERAVQVTERPNGVIYGDFAEAIVVPT